MQSNAPSSALSASPAKKAMRQAAAELTLKAAQKSAPKVVVNAANAVAVDVDAVSAASAQTKAMHLLKALRLATLLKLKAMKPANLAQMATSHANARLMAANHASVGLMAANHASVVRVTVMAVTVASVVSAATTTMAQATLRAKLQRSTRKSPLKTQCLQRTALQLRLMCQLRLWHLHTLLMQPAVRQQRHLLQQQCPKSPAMPCPWPTWPK